MFDSKTSAKSWVNFDKTTDDSPIMYGDIRTSNNAKGKCFVAYTSQNGDLRETLSIKVDLKEGNHKGELKTVKKWRSTSPDFKGTLDVSGGKLSVRGWLTTGKDGKKSGINLLFDPIPPSEFL